MHPTGSRKIKICHISMVYRTHVELPAQAWLGAFIALPQGSETLVTPEEYDLASAAFSALGLVYNVNTPWGTVPLGGSYSAPWYAPGLYSSH